MEEASPLHMACLKGNESLTSLLLDHSTEMEKEVEGSGTVLLGVPGAGLLPIVQETALSIAASRGHLEIVEQLLSARAMIADPSDLPNARSQMF